jgi:hypothetical protein
MHELQTREHSLRVRSFDQGELLSAKRDTAAKPSSTILPKRTEPKYPNYEMTSS